MDTKLTLRLDGRLIEHAKREARKRGTSVSKMVGDYFRKIDSPIKDAKPLPPVTASLLGSLSGKTLDREDYRHHLEQKYR